MSSGLNTIECYRKGFVMNFASLAQTLPIMLIGMVGIFLVIAVIILVVMLLGKLTGNR